MYSYLPENLTRDDNPKLTIKKEDADHMFKRLPTSELWTVATACRFLTEYGSINLLTGVDNWNYLMLMRSLVYHNQHDSLEVGRYVRGCAYNADFYKASTYGEMVEVKIEAGDDGKSLMYLASLSQRGFSDKYSPDEFFRVKLSFVPEFMDNLIEGKLRRIALRKRQEELIEIEEARILELQRQILFGLEIPDYKVNDIYLSITPP